MSRSRETLASTLAAATDNDSVSAFTCMSTCGTFGDTKFQRPSTTAESGFTDCAASSLKARVVAKRWAALMPSASHSSLVALPNAHAAHCRATSSKICSRRASVNDLESRATKSPSATSPERIATHTTSGPAQEPLPTSSTPHTTPDNERSKPNDGRFLAARCGEAGFKGPPATALHLATRWPETWCRPTVR